MVRNQFLLLSLLLMVALLVAPLAGYADPAAGTPFSPEITPENLQRAKEQLVGRLVARKFFRTGTCQDVLNTTLSMLKMPAVGTGRTDRSKSKKSDRAGENERRPKLRDTLEVKDPERLTTELVAAPMGASGWEIKITRSGQNRSLETAISFSTRENGDRLICDMKSVQFSLRKDGKPAEIGSTEDCLDPLIIDQTKYAVPVVADWIQRDCTFALIYSTKAKSYASAKGSAR